MFVEFRGACAGFLPPLNMPMGCIKKREVLEIQIQLCRFSCSIADSYVSVLKLQML